jgi:HK97 family phage major capsid protein
LSKEKLYARFNALAKEWEEIEAKADSEDRALTDEELARTKEIDHEMGSLKEQIELKNSISEREAFMSNPVEEPERIDPNPDVRKVEVGEDRSTLRPFDNFGEQIIAAVRAARSHGRDTDPRLLNPELRGDDPTGASEKVPADGGFLVQKDFSNEILRFAHENGMVAQRCRNIPVSGNGLIINAIDETSRANGSRWGGVQSYWKDEGAALEASQPKFRQIELILNKLTSLFYATDEVLQDANALSSIASQAFGEELAFKIDDAIINGSGAGQPLGILNANCLVTIDKEGSQTATTFVYENAAKMWARLYGRSQQNAVWFINQDVYPQLFTMSLAVGTGGAPVYMPAGGASASPYGTLFNRPVVPIEHCKTLGTAGDVILADFSQYLLINKGGVRSDSSIHVRFLNDEVVVRYILRTDGQPWMRSALTPANGSNTVSPFVVVQGRS